MLPGKNDGAILADEKVPRPKFGRRATLTRARAREGNSKIAVAPARAETRRYL